MELAVIVKHESQTVGDMVESFERRRWWAWKRSGRLDNDQAWRLGSFATQHQCFGAFPCSCVASNLVSFQFNRIDSYECWVCVIS